MRAEKRDKSAWRGFFDGISNILPGKQVEIEVDSPRIGARIASRYASLPGIVDDERSEILEIKAVGVEQIVRLRGPLMLPASGPA
ncbi:DUF5335 family protein [Massilia antarctica]|uniref:DUF5335 family protein n=2 Tax=Massilia antarctica TaxID=2765360 RepID=A0AA48WB39_9BURK|nr:DUF5335 family protein [Massilia antarctica]QPI48269.1 DUF5335 family protein [Massilia antarctica]